MSAEMLSRLQGSYDKYLKVFTEFLGNAKLPNLGPHVDFDVCGKSMFVRFDYHYHNDNRIRTDYGVLSYGVNEPGDVVGQVRRVIKLVFAFDAHGNVFDVVDGLPYTRNGIGSLIPEYAGSFHAGQVMKLCDGGLFSMPTAILTPETATS